MEQLNLELKITEFIKNGLTDKSIYRRLENENNSKEQLGLLISKMRLEHQKISKLNARKIWVYIAVILLIIGFFLIPFGYTGKSPIGIGILMGVLIGIAGFQVIGGFSNSDDLVSFFGQKNGANYPGPPMLVHFIPIVFFSILFPVFYTGQRHREIMNNGFVTSGKIVSGFEETNTSRGRWGREKTSTTNSLRISFKTKDNGIIVQDIEVSNEQYELASFRDSCQVFYSKQYPEFFEVKLEELSIQEKVNSTKALIEELRNR